MKNIPFDSPAFDPGLFYRVPAKLLAVQPPPFPDVKALTRCDPGPQHEGIHPWRDWTLEARSPHVEQRVSADGPAGGHVLRGGGAFGPGSALQYAFAHAGKLKPGRDRLACPVRGTAGQPVQFPVADGGRPITRATTIPLSPDWQGHVVEFEIEAPAQDETCLRFIRPKGATGEFAPTDPCRRELAAPPIQPKRQTPLATRDPASALTLPAATPTGNLSPG